MSTPVYSFRGGIRIKEKNNIAAAQTVRFPAGGIIELAFAMPGNAECMPTVNQGDRVLRAQMIADSASPLGCPVFSPVSGTAGECREREVPGLGKIRTLLIYNDAQNEPSPDMRPSEKKLSETTLAELLDFMRSRGVCDIDGDGSPLHALISKSAGRVRRLIVNCIESTPYKATSRRLLAERPGDVVNGARIIMKALGVTECRFAVGDNDPDGANALSKCLGRSDYMKICICEAKYPAENPRVLIKALSKNELSAKEDRDESGFAVFGPGTCAAAFYAFAMGLPLFERRISVGGDGCSEVKNLLIPTGVPYSEIIASAAKKDGKNICTDGLSLCGEQINDVTQPLTLRTGAVGLIAEKAQKPGACIHCGRCAAVCPMRLLPVYLVKDIKAGRTKSALKNGAGECIGCGACSYVCPGGVNPSAVIYGACPEDEQPEAAGKTDNRPESGEECI